MSLKLVTEPSLCYLLCKFGRIEWVAAYQLYPESLDIEESQSDRPLQQLNLKRGREHRDVDCGFAPELKFRDSGRFHNLPHRPWRMFG
jgi:hypothetical protein